MLLIWMLLIIKKYENKITKSNASITETETHTPRRITKNKKKLKLKNNSFLKVVLF